MSIAKNSRRGYLFMMYFEGNRRHSPDAFQRDVQVGARENERLFAVYLLPTRSLLPGGSEAVWGREV